MAPTRSRRAAGGARRALARSYDLASRRLTPERTRRATWFERRTVGALSWERLVQLNRALEFAGRAATALLVAFAASALLGHDWRHDAEVALNSGHTITGALALAVVFVLLGFIALRSAIGFARWRIQRELWRREVAALRASGPGDAAL